MDGDIYTLMQQEEADLARKLKAVREFLAAYGPGSTAEVNGTPAKKSPSGRREKVGITGFGTYGRRVIAEAMRSLATTSQPVKTRDLVPAIEAMGVTITGENKINALGALLARSADITSHGKQGWTLADREAGLKIVAEYGCNENEASKADADDASDDPPSSAGTAGWGIGPYSSRPLGAGESE